MKRITVLKGFTLSVVFIALLVTVITTFGYQLEAYVEAYAACYMGPPPDPIYHKVSEEDFPWHEEPLWCQAWAEGYYYGMYEIAVVCLYDWETEIADCENPKL